MYISVLLFESHRTVTLQTPIIFIARQVMRLRSGNSIQENATTGSNKLGVFDSSCKSNETATLQTTVWIWSKHLYNQCVARYQSYHWDYLSYKYFIMFYLKMVSQESVLIEFYLFFMLNIIERFIEMNPPVYF